MIKNRLRGIEFNVGQLTLHVVGIYEVRRPGNLLRPRSQAR